MKYKLLALDVDGTLVGRDGVVASDVVAAVAEARAAGLAVSLATGRSYAETLPIWRQLHLAPPLEPMVLIGGALVSEPDSGRTLYQRAIPRELACRLDEALAAAGHCAMAITDRWRTGLDYLSDRGRRPRRRAAPLVQPDGRPHPPRAAPGRRWPTSRRCCGSARWSNRKPGSKLSAALAERFDGRLNVHCILAPNYGLTVVEAFAPGTDKLTAIRYVAQALPAADRPRGRRG